MHGKDAVPRLIWRLFKQPDTSETATIMSHHSYPMNMSHLFHVISADEGQRLFVCCLKKTVFQSCVTQSRATRWLLRFGFFYFVGRRSFELDYFLSKFCQRKGGEIRWCVRKKASRKLSVISHVTNWIASNRKSVAIASDKPLSRETAGSWQTRGNLKGTEAFGCKLTLDIKHLTSFYFLGEKVFETQAICMYIQV